jgi:gliding motility-associated-like protein
MTKRFFYFLINCILSGNLAKIVCVILLLLSVSLSIAQPCSGTLGDAVVDETFGAGVSNIGAPLASNMTSNITYLPSNCFTDGNYSIVNYTSGCFSGNWATMTDHTGDPNGYYMLVNANILPSDFFIDTVSNLCSGTSYQFGSYITNMCTVLQIFPNIIFTIEKTDGTILASYGTGDIPTATDPVVWNQYSFSFTMPAGVSNVVLRMHNNAPGGNGNDFALDDITFKPIGPPIAVSMIGHPGPTATVCSGDPAIAMTAVVGSCYVTTAYQWQVSTDSLTWADIPGATGINYTRMPTGPGKYFYHLLVAEAGNINSPSCRVHSDPITIIVNATPVISSVTSVDQTCSHLNGSFTLNGLDPTTNYTINFNKNGAPQSSGSFITNPSGNILISGLSQGSYTAITATSTLGCVSAPITITLTNKIDTTFSNKYDTVCSNMLPYHWNARTYTATSNDSILLPNAAGCDSLARLFLVIKDTSFSIKRDTVCSNMLPYHWNTRTYTTSKSDSIMLQNAAGCDSLTKLFLVVKDTSFSIKRDTVCSNMLPYVWNTRSYTASRSDSVMLQNAAGCDSLARLFLVVEDTSFSVKHDTVCSNMLPYVWNTRSYTTSKSDSIMLHNTAGCDSLVRLFLVVKDTSFSTKYDTVCSNTLPYIWNTRSYTASKSDSVMLHNAAGCDSLARLFLVVKDTLFSIKRDTVCSNMLPYSWNARTYTTSKSDSILFHNAAGCDSLARLFLVVKDTSFSVKHDTVCSNMLPYIWNTRSYTTSKSDSIMLHNTAGCDSLARLFLIVRDTSFSVKYDTVCSNMLPYHWNARTYTTSKSDSIMLHNSAGCDSLARLFLLVKDTSFSIKRDTVCSNMLPFIWNARTYTNSKSDSVMLQNAAGCDSLARLFLVVKDTSFSVQHITICSNMLPYIWNAHSYTTSQSDSVMLQNHAGCDSLARLFLVVNDTSFSEKHDTVCSNMLPYIWNARSYTTSKSDSIMLHNVAGCDSLVRLILVVKDTSFSIKRDTVCVNMLPYTWNTRNYTTSKSDSIMLQNAAGCDSVARLFLVVVPNYTPTITVTTDANKNNICQGQPVNFTANIFSTGTTAPLYQWNINGIPLAGAVASKYSTDTLSLGANAITCTIAVQGIGCFSSATVTSTPVVVTVSQIPKIILTAKDSIINEGGSTQIFATVDPATGINYEWSSSDNSFTSTIILSPIISPTETTTYTLVAYNENNQSCTDNASIIVTVYTDFFMPNAFTPGNNINNVFRIPPGVVFDLQDFSIYNRWGNLIFETSDINKGWDGNYMGQPCNTAGYVYLITGSDLSGKVVHKGTFLLIR